MQPSRRQLTRFLRFTETRVCPTFCRAATSWTPTRATLSFPLMGRPGPHSRRVSRWTFSNRILSRKLSPKRLSLQYSELVLTEGLGVWRGASNLLRNSAPFWQQIHRIWGVLGPWPGAPQTLSPRTHGSRKAVVTPRVSSAIPISTVLGPLPSPRALPQGPPAWRFLLELSDFCHHPRPTAHVWLEVLEI